MEIIVYNCLKINFLFDLSLPFIILAEHDNDDIEKEKYKNFNQNNIKIYQYRKKLSSTKIKGFTRENSIKINVALRTADVFIH